MKHCQVEVEGHRVSGVEGQGTERSRAQTGELKMGGLGLWKMV